MDIFWNELTRYFSDAGTTRRIVLLGTMLLGIASGIIGTFAVLRKQSLLGDAMAHAALPGVCIAFLFTGQKSTIALLLGAIMTGLLAAGTIVFLNGKRRVKEDSAIGLVLSCFFGLGIVLLTVIQKRGMSGQSGLDHFIFGKAASLLKEDVLIIAGLCLIVICVVSLFYKEFKILSFDPQFATSLGLPTKWLNYGLTALMVIAVMIGLQAVGVILMVAMLILPAAAARQWTNRLSIMLVLAGLFGGISGILGAVFSSIFPKISTGPIMVLSASSILIISVLVAPNRGVLTRLWRHYQESQRIGIENCVKILYKNSCSAMRDPFQGPYWIDIKEFWRSQRIGFGILRKLQMKKFAIVSEGKIQLTEKGIIKACEILRRHRLWEAYLYTQMNIAQDHLHRDAEQIEHVLSPELTKEISEALTTCTTVDSQTIPIEGIHLEEH